MYSGRKRFSGPLKEMARIVKDYRWEGKIVVAYESSNGRSSQIRPPGVRSQMGGIDLNPDASANLVNENYENTPNDGVNEQTGENSEPRSDNIVNRGPELSTIRVEYSGSAMRL